MTTAQQPKQSASGREAIVVEFDYSDGGTWVSAECQLGVHRACPGGLKGDPKRASGGGDWICHCDEEMCPCRQKLT